MFWVSNTAIEQGVWGWYNGCWKPCLIKLLLSVTVPIFDGWPNEDSKIVLEIDEEAPKEDITFLFIDWAFPIL